jgi:hypothetical protein
MINSTSLNEVHYPLCISIFFFLVLPVPNPSCGGARRRAVSPLLVAAALYLLGTSFGSRNRRHERVTSSYSHDRINSLVSSFFHPRLWLLLQQARPWQPTPFVVAPIVKLELSTATTRIDRHRHFSLSHSYSSPSGGLHSF